MPRNLVPLLFAATLSAQTGNLTAYPQDSTQNSGGSMVPFGASSDGRYAEGRTQMLVPAPYLPGPGAVLTALWVKCQSSVAIHYGSLQITVAPTTTAALSTTFGDNLASPVVVLPASNLTVNYTAQWTQIPFTTQYVHDGVSSLVIDVQKAVVVPFPSAVMASTGSPRRSDLPNMLYATGILGSAASVAAAATISDFTLAVRLEWTVAPAVRLKSDPFGAAGHHFAIGGSLDVTVNGAAGALYVDLMGLSLQAVPLPPILGLFRVNGVTVGTGILNGAGASVLTLPIPANPAIAGLPLAMQSAVFEAGTQVIRFTNAADCFIRL